MKINTRFLDPKTVLFQSSLSRGNTVLDLGAGSGHFAIAAAQLVGEAGKVIVVDVVETALEHVSAEARMHGLRNIQTIRKDLESGSIDRVEAGSVDFVIVANLLHQLKKPAQLFPEIYRMLKTGGRVLVIDWNGSASMIGPKAKSRIGDETVKQAAEKSKFKFSENIETDQYHYGLIFIK